MSGLLKERFGCARGECGQMTVELAVMIPVLVAIAVIAMNAMLFFSECAAFDRLARIRCACSRRLRLMARTRAKAAPLRLMQSRREWVSRTRTT